MIVAVTAFVPIPGHPRPPEEYHRLAAPLRAMSSEIPLLAAVVDLDQCWLYQYLDEGHVDEVEHPVSDNPRKNSLAYHIVQAQKTDFMMSAAAACGIEPDVYVWIDYGILHVPGVTTDIIRDFLKRAENEQAIAIPGCWGPDYDYDDDHPCWRFCGGVMVVPRQYLAEFDLAMKEEYIYWLQRFHRISWEVNTLARVERRTNLPIWWYQADHDATMFTNYQATKYADGAHDPRLAHTVLGSMRNAM
jgi:hypothetical protein